MNILYGLATPDEGEIRINDQPVVIADPADAIDRGIGMVHQHFMLVPVLSVADNILLGDETMANPIFIDRQEAAGKIRELGTRFGFEIDPDAKVGRLSVGWQQRVEILKALYRDARILVLDEPTAVLTPQETKEIFTVLRSLAAEGTASSSSASNCTKSWRSPTGSRSSVVAGWSASGSPARHRRTTSPSSWSVAAFSSWSTAASLIRGSRSLPSRICMSATIVARNRFTASASRFGPARSWASPPWPGTARMSSSRRSPACAARPTARSASTARW